jgi:4-amino-4-deoxy-L-arabinose transferase-like glycosyltransferase
LALLAAVFALYHIGLQLYDPRSALAAAALFSSGFLVLGEVHLAKTDTVLMALALAQQWALMQLYLAWQTASHHRVTAGYGFGLRWPRGFWSKGRFCRFWHC